MHNRTNTIEWVNDYLLSQGYILQNFPEIVLETPWSNVIKFSTGAFKNEVQSPFSHMIC